MASNYTSNYSLCQWAEDDKVLRTDFNADNAKIDAAVKAVDRRVDGLSSAVAGKASASALESLSQTVSQQGAALAKAGNCQLYATTYVGNGKYGAGNPNRLTFPRKPVVVFITQYRNCMTLIRGWEQGRPSEYSNGFCFTTWGDKTLEWYGHDITAQMNGEGITFAVLALLQTD